MVVPADAPALVRPETSFADINADKGGRAIGESHMFDDDGVPRNPKQCDYLNV
ncbi:hypothetical protein LL912_24220 [Niabella sp. CC-SYL272]|uniref:hypothetical protein n=1 Tax=Niabella agricola TaxID=2891571 RepID=UPI001F3F4A79|nr:hypothetical protein [Niabella agricola]MCF3111916.1 hypothetical protein [Niabella agricola]